METKRGILFPSFITTTHLLTITFGLSAYNFNVRKTLYSHINLEELITLYSSANLQIFKIYTPLYSTLFKNLFIRRLLRTLLFLLQHFLYQI